MPMQPLDIQKTRFALKMRGYDPVEVENFLALVAEDLTQRLGEIERLERDNRSLRERVASAELREHQLHDAILRGKKVSEEMIQTSQREAQMLVREAELTAERMVGQAAERAAEVERSIGELRLRRKELQLKFKSTLELFGQILEAEMEDERTTATVHTLTRRPKSGAFRPSTSRSMNPMNEPQRMSMTRPESRHLWSQRAWRTAGSSGENSAIHWNSSSARTSFSGPFHASSMARSAALHPSGARWARRGVFRASAATRSSSWSASLAGTRWPAT